MRRRIVLVLDEDDYRDLMEEFAERKNRELADGKSNKAGAMIAEMARDLNEYRGFFPGLHDDAKRLEALREAIKHVGTN